MVWWSSYTVAYRQWGSWLWRPDDVNCDVAKSRVAATTTTTSQQQRHVNALSLSLSLLFPSASATGNWCMYVVVLPVEFEKGDGRTQRQPSVTSAPGGRRRSGRESGSIDCSATDPDRPALTTCRAASGPHPAHRPPPPQSIWAVAAILRRTHPSVRPTWAWNNCDDFKWFKEASSPWWWW